MLAGAIPRPVGLSAPLEPGTAKQVLPLQGSMEVWNMYKSGQDAASLADLIKSTHVLRMAFIKYKYD